MYSSTLVFFQPKSAVVSSFGFGRTIAIIFWSPKSIGNTFLYGWHLLTGFSCPVFFYCNIFTCIIVNVQIKKREKKYMINRTVSWSEDTGNVNIYNLNEHNDGWQRQKKKFNFEKIVLFSRRIGHFWWPSELHGPIWTSRKFKCFFI